ncbi:MAG: tRNA pseudouridine(38-40) synthase TruA, partial [Parvibaculales bacterium]
LKAYAWRVPEKVDIAAMEAGASHLVGRHDFSSFRASGCQSNSPVKSIKTIRISREGEHIFVDVAAQSFLYHQIRSIVGCLKQIGVGKWESGKIKDVLEAKDRSLCATLAPAHGLYFMGVDYPAEK